MVNVLDRVAKKQQPQAKAWLRQLMYAQTREAATELKRTFQQWCEQSGCRAAGELLDDDWDRLVAYYDFPEEHWKHLRTTNLYPPDGVAVESPFAAVRLRTTAAKRYNKVERATAVIWKTLMLAEQRFRRINAPELLPLVAAQIPYRNGKRMHCHDEEREKVAA